MGQGSEGFAHMPLNVDYRHRLNGSLILLDGDGLVGSALDVASISAATQCVRLRIVAWPRPSSGRKHASRSAVSKVAVSVNCDFRVLANSHSVRHLSKCLSGKLRSSSALLLA
jgi:hypothetical protein